MCTYERGGRDVGFGTVCGISLHSVMLSLIVGSMQYDCTWDDVPCHHLIKLCVPHLMAGAKRCRRALSGVVFLSSLLTLCCCMLL